MTTGSHGDTVIKPFYDSPQVNQPIKRIALTRGDCVFGLEVGYANRTSGWRGGQDGTTTNYDIWPGEKIVEVRGRCEPAMRHWKQYLYYLRFTTNRGRSFEAGNPSSDAPEWVSKPEAGTNAHLIGISGWLAEEQWVLHSVYLHWQYDRWL